MEWSQQQAGAPRAYEVFHEDGRSAIVYALHHGTAKNRGGKLLGIKKTEVKSCVLRPDLDHQAPAKDNRLGQGRPIPQDILDLEAKNPGLRCCYACMTCKLPDEFTGSTKSRECKSCRSQRWANMDDAGRVGQLLAMARHRARAKRIPFSLSASDISIPARCPVLGIPISFSTIADRHNSPSLDRLKPELGYVPGNVLVVSWLANDIRRNFSPADIITVGRFYQNLEAKTA